MRFSLYLSSQLMYGLSYVYKKQCNMLLDDIKHLMTSMSSFKIFRSGDPLETIDLEVPISKSKVTLELPDMTNVPLEFGVLKPLPEPSHHSYEGFLVTTPRSSEKSSDYPHAEPFPEGLESLHTVDPSSIMIAEPPVESEEPIPEMVEEDIDWFTDDNLLLRSSEPGLDPGVAVDIESMPTPAAERLERLSPPRTSPVPQRLDLPGQLTPPTAPTGIDGHPTPLAAPKPPAQIDGTPHPSPPAGQRRALFDALDTPTLPVSERRTRRPRRPHLIIDQEIRLSAAEIRNYTTAPVTFLTVPFGQRIASVSDRQSTSSLLRGLSARNIPSGIANIVSRYRTLPAPTDDSLHFMESESEEHEEVRQQVSVEEDVIEMEEHRGHELEGTLDPTLSGLLKTSSLEVGDSSSGTTFFYTKDTIISPMPVLHEDVLLEAEEIIDEPVVVDASKPAELSAESIEQRDVTMQRPPNEACPTYLSDRISPPSSYQSITFRLMETLELIQRAVYESSEPDCTKFTAVIAMTEGTKKHVSRLFSDLLHLHARRFIYVEQKNAVNSEDQEIFIHLLSVESGTSDS